MYTRSSHQPRSSADVLQIIRENMFGTLVTCGEGGMMATHLPFLIDDAATTLFAHMARANAQSAMLNGEALVMFQGPHAYISPSWYEDRATAPTWDYIAVHCYGTPRLHSEDEARGNIERLIAIVEATSQRPWAMDELSEESIRALLRNVVSFEIALTRIEGKFKLNQGEKKERNQAALTQLEQSGAGELASWMRRYNDL